MIDVKEKAKYILEEYSNCYSQVDLEKLAKYLDQIKAEAYEDFAEKAIEKVEKVKQKYQRLCREQGEEMEEAMNIHFNGMINLLKEMVGEG